MTMSKVLNDEEKSILWLSFILDTAHAHATLFSFQLLLSALRSLLLMKLITR